MLNQEQIEARDRVAFELAAIVETLNDDKVLNQITALGDKRQALRMKNTILTEIVEDICNGLERLQSPDPALLRLLELALRLSANLAGYDMQKHCMRVSQMMTKYRAAVMKKYTELNGNISVLKTSLDAADLTLRRTYSQLGEFDRWATVPDCVGCMVDMFRDENTLRGAERLPNDETLRRTMQDELSQRESKRAANANFYRITDIAEVASICCGRFTAAQYIKDFQAVSCAGNNLRRAKKPKTI